ncbi:MAG: phosphoribosylamine--glycine ligase [Melioribacteraceae bacterium]|nr:phosphoribosylamine--glycine ligase [Melioribacteraceae bacterium]
MKVAIIGGGGREHVIALKISESNLLNELFILPGNPGTEKLGTNVPIKSDDINGIVKFCTENKIELVIIGPEKPLTMGLAEGLIENDIKVFGPTKAAARIEGEKSFAKNLMMKYNIPTASFKVFHKENYDDALNYLKRVSYPIVIKADGIASGKGVIIPETYEDAKEAVKECFVNSSFGKAGEKIVIEEYMTGQEASVFAITDGNDFVLLPAAQDHKRIFDGDKGKNTGGMGAYAPTPFVNENDYKIISDKIIKPTLEALNENKSKFVGCLYCGLMMTSEGPKVVEFNCRFGDPETQVVLPLISGDFLELLFSASNGNINKNSISIENKTSVCVVLASKGYPDKVEKGIEIFGIDDANKCENISIIHAGTKKLNNKILTDGGRVLNIVGTINSNNLKLCKEITYNALSKINFDGMQYRKDIADKAIN